MAKITFHPFWWTNEALDDDNFRENHDHPTQAARRPVAKLQASGAASFGSGVALTSEALAVDNFRESRAAKLQASGVDMSELNPGFVPVIPYG